MNRAEILEACMKDEPSMAAAFKRAQEVSEWLASGTVAELSDKPVAAKKKPQKLTGTQRAEILRRLEAGLKPPAVAREMGIPAFQVRYVRSKQRQSESA